MSLDNLLVAAWIAAVARRRREGSTIQALSEFRVLEPGDGIPLAWCGVQIPLWGADGAVLAKVRPPKLESTPALESPQ